MTSLLARIFGYNGHSNGDGAYDKAMHVSDDLIARMRDASESSDPARAVMADIWAQRNNVPYITTTYQAVQELNAALYQDPDESK